MPTFTSRLVFCARSAQVSRSAPTRSGSCTDWGSPSHSYGRCALRVVGLLRLAERRSRRPGAAGPPGRIRWGAPFYNVHRADLHDLLRAAVGEEHITLGADCVSVDQDDTGAAAGFADGRRERGDLLIGADGIHSVVRDYVTGLDLPTWWPQIAWRGLAPAAIGREVGLEMRQHVFFGPDVLFVTYYVSSGRW